MASGIPGLQLRRLILGTRVDRAAATIPQTAQSAIFNVTGGRIVVTGLVGEVTTVIGGTATTLKVTGNPAVGSDVDLTSATAITSKEVGSLITLPLTLGSGLVVNSAGAGQLPSGGFVVPVGTIDLVTSASTTGAIKWSLTYVPWDDGGAVTAA